MKKPDEIIAEFRQTLNTITPVKEKVNAIVVFSMIYGDCFAEKVMPLLREGLKLSTQHHLPLSELILNYTLHFFTAQSRGKADALDYDLMEEQEKIACQKQIETENYPLVLNLKAFLQWFEGEYEKAFETVYDAINHCKKTENLFLGWNLYALAVFFFDTNDLESAKKNFDQSLNCFKKLGEQYGYARSANGLGSVCLRQNKSAEAIEYFNEASAIYRKMSQYSGLGRIHNDLGHLEMLAGNFPAAIKNFEESIFLREEIQHFQGLATTYTLMGETYLLSGNYPAALVQLEKGLAYAKAVNSKLKQINCYKKLYETYKKLNQTDLALKNFEIFYEMKSVLMSDETTNNIRKIQTKFERETAEKEAEIQRLINVELKQANEIIRQKNKDITDSISYARRIQTAILPPRKIIKQYLENSFVLYKPKDIVAGDFYWMESIGEHILFAACDCTGHGVPGAMVSVVCHNALNRAVREFELVQPSKILDKTAELVLENFAKSEEEIQDGMDISICLFHTKSRILEWSGANNPLWIIQSGKLIETKPDKQSIGSGGNSIPFTNHRFMLENGSNIYLFTDGYADQFGGQNDKKLTNKKFRELILSLQHLPLAMQAAELDRFINQFKKDGEQTDDILVLGVRV